MVADTYATSDLQLASFLRYRGARLVRVESIAPGRSEFVLVGVTDEALDAYIDDEPVPVRSYLAAFRELKQALAIANSRSGGWQRRTQDTR